LSQHIILAELEDNAKTWFEIEYF